MMNFNRSDWVRYAIVMILITLFAIHTWGDQKEKMNHYLFEQETFLYYEAKGHGYEGEKNKDSVIAFLNQKQKVDNFSYEEQSKISAAQSAMMLSPTLLGLKKALILFLFLIIPYHVFEYFLTKPSYHRY
ncbi:hypothetical protein HZY91_04495 [Facklamia sp. DSM 111018]|uniref:Uncharacterized protein n=1 Tax=Facklamia lactis TaxID=2749967 RepID=A0ABS0LPT6_9LACT|nr:hypothetical protein [Facklamia lactis]MBG9980348.1 hypothetical protein [Facklamia lactis]MBG9986152.1 hypothetical protein [Facklamia lactis]